MLTDNPSNRGRVRNLFFELHYVLQHFHKHSIFSLFISTSGRFNLFSANPQYISELSNRVRDPNSCPFDPISEISFDSVVYPTALHLTELGLDQVVNFEWIAHIGRPLYVYSSDPFGEQQLSYHPQLDLGLVGTAQTSHLI